MIQRHEANKRTLLFDSFSYPGESSPSQLFLIKRPNRGSVWSCGDATNTQPVASFLS